MLSFLGFCICRWRSARRRPGRSTGTPEPPFQNTNSFVSAYLVVTHFLTRAYLAHPWVFVGLLVGVSISNVAFFACSSFSKQVVLRAPACWIVGLQLFRVLLEYCMHLGYVQGAVPQQMTVHGDNFDIVTGVLAFAVSIGSRSRRSSRTFIICAFSASSGHSLIHFKKISFRLR